MQIIDMKKKKKSKLDVYAKKLILSFNYVKTAINFKNRRTLS